MTIDRNHPALINNDNTIFDLPIDETAQLITDAVAYYAINLAYVTENPSDSHFDDFTMITDILHQLMPLTKYDLADLDNNSYRHRLELAFKPSLINDILYFEHYNNCAQLGDRPDILDHFNQLTEDQLDELIND